MTTAEGQKAKLDGRWPSLCGQSVAYWVQYSMTGVAWRQVADRTIIIDFCQRLSRLAGTVTSKAVSGSVNLILCTSRSTPFPHLSSPTRRTHEQIASATLNICQYSVQVSSIIASNHIHVLQCTGIVASPYIALVMHWCCVVMRNFLNETIRKCGFDCFIIFFVGFLECSLWCIKKGGDWERAEFPTKRE